MSLFKPKRIYMDYAAATPVLPEVRRAMDKYWSRDFYNPNAIYAEGEKVRKEVEHFRSRVAEILGVRKSSIVFTSGGTEANVLAVRSVSPGKVVVEEGSHPSVEEAVRDTRSSKVVLMSSAVVDGKLGRKVRKERKESGSEHPLLHIDASQGAQYFDVRPEKLLCDLLTLDSSKLYGPKGVGALVVRSGVELDLPPLGTPAVPLIAGFATALEIAVRDRAREYKRLESLSTYFASRVSELLPSVEVTQELPHIINLSVPGVLPEMLVLALDREGVMVSAGPACTSRSPEPPETPVRFSLGRFTTKKEVDRAIKIFCQAVAYVKIGH